MNFTRGILRCGLLVTKELGKTSFVENSCRLFCSRSSLYSSDLFPWINNYKPIFTATRSKGTIHPDIGTLPTKKRTIRKKRTDEELRANGYFNVTAFTTAEEYNLEGVVKGLEAQDLYDTKRFFSTDNLSGEQDVLYVSAKYQVNNEARDIFFFREGSVVLWNCNELESANVLSFLRQYERDRYAEILIQGESETMSYNYLKDELQPQLRDDRFYLTKDQENYLEKYTFSNALATSVKLGMWEATLDKYIDSMEFITEDLRRGTKIRISRRDLLRKTGELFALRHLINLSSDCLDTPDFYWDREELEVLYTQVCTYFSIARRVRVMNEKLNHCVELAELVSSNLNDAHHVRLEWMIIILIMVEVLFEIVHYAERYLSHEEDGSTVATSNTVSQ